MNKSFYKDEIKFRLRYELIQIIEEVGRMLNEDEVFLREYILDVCNEWDHDLKTAIACFTDILDQVTNCPSI